MGFLYPKVDINGCEKKAIQLLYVGKIREITKRCVNTTCIDWRPWNQTKLTKPMSTHANLNASSQTNKHQVQISLHMHRSS